MFEKLCGVINRCSRVLAFHLFSSLLVLLHEIVIIPQKGKKYRSKTSYHRALLLSHAQILFRNKKKSCGTNVELKGACAREREREAGAWGSDTCNPSDVRWVTGCWLPGWLLSGGVVGVRLVGLLG